MSAEIRTGWPSGASLSAVVRRRVDAYVWYPAGTVWEAHGTGGRTNSDYDIALTDKLGDYYIGTFDANITDPDLYDVLLLVGGVFSAIHSLKWDGSQRDETYKKLAEGAGYIGNFKKDRILSFFWESGQVTASGGAIRVYKGGNTDYAIYPTGVTEAIDFAGVKGRHRVEIDLGATPFYAIENDYGVVRSSVIIFGQIVTLVIAEFSIEHRYEHKPFRPGG
jgi:hypothetical protein